MFRFYLFSLQFPEYGGHLPRAERVVLTPWLQSTVIITVKSVAFIIGRGAHAVDEAQGTE